MKNSQKKNRKSDLNNKEKAIHDGARRRKLKPQSKMKYKKFELTEED